MADANSDCRELLSLYLKLLNYPAPTEATDGEDLVYKACNVRPDLIIMEIFLPKKDGFQVTAHLRASPLTRDTRIVAATAMALPGDREKCLSSGFDGYLAKPFTMSELGQLLDAIFSQAASPSIA